MGNKIWQARDCVRITYEGMTVEGSIKLASGNGRSLVLEFDGVLGEDARMKLVLQGNDGLFRDLFTDRKVGLDEVARKPG